MPASFYFQPRRLVAFSAPSALFRKPGGAGRKKVPPLGGIYAAARASPVA